MDRQTVIVPESKETINKIKQKYKNMQMSDDTAKKIQGLEVTNKVLKAASSLATVAFVIDMIVPDPVIGMDEALLGFITAATTSANKIVADKIDSLAKTGDAKLEQEEIIKLSKSIGNIAQNIANKNTKQF